MVIRGCPQPRDTIDIVVDHQCRAVYDYHAHTNYSDGRFMFRMARAAERAGLDGIGFTDHCTVTEREFRREERASYGFNLDATYERRRQGIESLREDADVAIYDAVEMDYHPDDEGEIADFLAEAGFDYAIGSVHELDDANVQVPSNYVDRSDDELDRLVDEYFDHLVALIESELFDIAAHVDLVERNPALRGYATEDHYRAVAEAATDSRTKLELNAGRVLADYGEFHPNPSFLDVLAEYGVEFVPGTDSHDPTEVGERKEELEKFVAAHGLNTAGVSL